MKICNFCKENKELKDFHKDKRLSDGHRSKCKECVKKYTSKFYKDNQEALVQKARQSYIKNKNIHLERSKKYRQNNLESCTKKDKKYRENNPHKLAEQRAKKSNRVPKWSDLETTKLYYQTRKALSEATGIEYQVDHIIPLRNKVVSGLHVPENLQIITRRKNEKKSNKFPL